MIRNYGTRPANQNEQNELKGMLADIAAIAKLGFSDKINLEFSDEVVRRDIVELMDAGLAKRGLIREYIPESSNWKEMQEDRPRKKASTDILGTYSPDSRTIRIYERTCEIVAKSLEISPDDLVKVVMAHEAAHAVTHLGRDDGGNIWVDFSNADRNDLEKFAQSYSLSYLKNRGLRNQEDIFLILSKHQSLAYNTWGEYL